LLGRGNIGVLLNTVFWVREKKKHKLILAQIER